MAHGRKKAQRRDITKLYDWEIERIYLEQIGYVPEPVMRDFVRLATGKPQPEKDPVTVVSPRKMLLVYGRDEQAGTLLFMPLSDALHDAAVAVSVVLAKTWGRFKKLEPYRCDHMQRGIAYESPFRCFASFARIHGDGRSRAEIAREYNSLDWREHRPPRGRDSISLAELSEQAGRYKLDMPDPLREMSTTLPRWILEKFGREVRVPGLEKPRITFARTDEGAILAALGELGFTVLLDQLLVDCFLGRETDRERVRARVRGYERLEDGLWSVEARAMSKPPQLPPWLPGAVQG
jgi:hypothetical protein